MKQFKLWFWLDILQVHRSASNKMDLSPDIDPTEISRILKSTTLTTQISYYLDNQMIGINSLEAVKYTNELKKTIN